MKDKKTKRRAKRVEVQKNNFAAYITTQKERQQLLLVEAIAGSITFEDILWAKEELKIEEKANQKHRGFAPTLFDIPTTLSHKERVLKRIISAPTITQKEIDKATEAIFKENSRFIRKESRKYHINNEICLLEDIYQAGVEGFLIALRDFDIKKIFENGLRSYAVWKIKKGNTDQITLLHKRVGQQESNLTWRTQARKYHELYYSRYHHEPSGEALYDFVIEHRYQEFEAKMEKQEGRILEESEIVILIKKTYHKEYNQFVKTYDFDFEELIEYVFSPSEVKRENMKNFLENEYYVHSLEEQDEEGYSMLDSIENIEALIPDEANDFSQTEMYAMYKKLCVDKILTDLEIGIFERRVGLNGYSCYNQKTLKEATDRLGYKLSLKELNAYYENTVELISFTWQLSQKKNPYLNS